MTVREVALAVGALTQQLPESRVEAGVTAFCAELLLLISILAGGSEDERVPWRRRVS